MYIYIYEFYRLRLGVFTETKKKTKDSFFYFLKTEQMVFGCLHKRFFWF